MIIFVKGLGTITKRFRKFLGFCFLRLTSFKNPKDSENDYFCKGSWNDYKKV